MVGDWDFGLEGGFSSVFGVLFVLAIIWVMFLKIYGLWRGGRNNQPIWFVFMAVFNTAGLLPLIYLLFFQKEGFVKIKKEKSRKKKR